VSKPQADNTRTSASRPFPDNAIAAGLTVNDLISATGSTRHARLQNTTSALHGPSSTASTRCSRPEPDPLPATTSRCGRAAARPVTTAPAKFVDPAYSPSVPVAAHARAQNAPNDKVTTNQTDPSSELGRSVIHGTDGLSSPRSAAHLAVCSPTGARRSSLIHRAEFGRHRSLPARSRATSNAAPSTPSSSILTGRRPQVRYDHAGRSTTRGATHGGGFPRLRTVDRATPAVPGLVCCRSKGRVYGLQRRSRRLTDPRSHVSGRARGARPESQNFEIGTSETGWAASSPRPCAGRDRRQGDRRRGAGAARRSEITASSSLGPA
jgi:hypothetical protein